MESITFKGDATLATPSAAEPAGVHQGFHMPAKAQGVVVIAASDAKLERDGLLVATLHDAGLGTLMLEVASPATGSVSQAIVRTMMSRLVAAGDWLATQHESAGLPLGVFGSDVASGAVLAAAASRPDMFRAVVSRTGRLELAGSALDQVRAATLLIVAGHDHRSIASHQEAMTRVRGIAELEIVPGPSDTLDEPDANAHVARLTRRWFTRFLA
jgi:putative phosphoribosyl transferase